RHGEPDRARGHLPPAGGAAGPLPAAAVLRLPDLGAGVGGGLPPPGPSPRGAAGRRGARRSGPAGRPGGGRGGPRRGLGGPLRGRSRLRDPRAPARPGGRLPARHPRPHHLRPRAGRGPRAHLRGARGRQGSRPRRPRPPRDGQARALAAERDRRGRGRVGAAADRGAGCGPPAGDGGSGRGGRGRAGGRARVRPVRMRPTAALARAAIVGCGAFALAVLLGRPALVLVGLPLMAWALMAVAARIGRGEERGIKPPPLLTGRRTVEEGGSTSVGLRGTPGLLTAASVPLLPHTVLAPRHGALAADGELRIRVDARRWGRIRLGPVHTVVADGLGAFRAQLTLPPVDLHAVPASSVLDAPVEVPTPIGVSGVHLSRRRGDGTALSEV